MKSTDTDRHKELAIHGGPKAVTQDHRSVTRWPVMADDYVARVLVELRAGRISMADGGVISEFEKRWAELLGVKYALAQCSGTSTLHAAYFAAGVGPGDEVIVPSYTWCASATPAYALGANVVFAEVDPTTLTLDPGDIEHRITPRTKAICVIHLWGNVADMDGILEVAHKHGITVIEDCSHAHGAKYKGRAVGSIGDVGCFSMQGSKAIYGGEAGVIVTNRDDFFDRIVILGHQGRIPRTALDADLQTLETGLGFKYRPHPLGIALALAQLDGLESLNEIRGRNVAALDEMLSGLPGVETVKVLEGAERGGYYEYRFMYDEEATGIAKAKVIAALKAEGVDIDHCRYPLLHSVALFRQPHPIWEIGLRRFEKKEPVSLPVSERVWNQLLRLPPLSAPADALLREYRHAFEKVFANLEGLDTVHKAC